MDPITASALIGVAGGALSAGGGIIGRNKQHKRNLQYMAQQNEYSKELMEKSQQQQLEMWEKTNYAAQVGQMDKAGLNAGLLYGMGGTGGATTGSAGGGGGGLPSAPVGNAGADAIAGAQLGLMQAQKANIEAQTDKTKAETEGTGISNESAEIDLAIKNEIGADAYARQARIQQHAGNAENAKKIREFDTWMEEAFDANGELKVDGYGTYGSSKNDLIRGAIKAGLKTTVQELQNLKAEYAKDQSQATLNKIESEIREFKVDLNGLGLNETSASIINAIIQGVFGMKMQSMRNKAK